MVYICCIFSEHLFLRTLLVGCFCQWSKSCGEGGGGRLKLSCYFKLVPAWKSTACRIIQIAIYIYKNDGLERQSEEVNKIEVFPHYWWELKSGVFLGKGVLKTCSKFTGEHPCRSAISIKLQSNFIETRIFRELSSLTSLIEITLRVLL